MIRRELVQVYILLLTKMRNAALSKARRNCGLQAFTVLRMRLIDYILY